ncbi:MAG TPA: hypothetical protein VIC85_18645 [Ktedonobacterales bacterium]|jgi:hypothetical protein
MPRFGRVLKQSRECGELTLSGLARNLEAAGFREFEPDEEKLARLLRHLEWGARWPLGDEARIAFLKALAVCLGQEAYGTIVRAVAADILEHEAPGLAEDVPWLNPDGGRA